MSIPYVVIVDDDPAFAKRLATALEGLFRVEMCHSEEEFRERFAVGRFDLIIMDMRLKEGREGIDLLKEVQTQDPMQAAIVMTAYADLESYADALESGALTYLDKREFSPVLIARTVEALAQQGALRKRVAAMEQQLEQVEPLEIIGASTRIREVRAALQRAAEDGSTPVLITGEPGTGKELVARNIHRLSRRRADGPFVAACCDRLQPARTQTLFFGTFECLETRRAHESKGWMDEAKGGILFVDGVQAIEEKALRMLLRYIETRAFTRVGGESPIEGDVQIIFATTTRNLGDTVFAEFRRELLDRYSGFDICVHPLRERTEDISLIAQYTLQNLYRQGRTQVRSFRGSAIAVLESRPWPGNVRELKSAVEYAAIRADAVHVREIGPEHLPQSASDAPPRFAAVPSALDYQLHLARAELGLVESTIETFETTKKSDLATKLHYSDRFTFVRRIRRCLEIFPALEREFPKTTDLFANKRRMRTDKLRIQTDANG